MTSFQFANIVKHNVKDRDSHLVSWYELIDGSDLADQNSDYHQDAVYMKLHLAHTNDSDDISKQTKIMEYWKDHFVLEFLKEAGTTDKTAIRRFVTKTYKTNRDNVAHAATRTANAGGLYVFESIAVKTLSEDSKTFPYYEVIIGYSNPEGQEFIPWKEPFVQFQVGEYTARQSCKSFGFFTILKKSI